MLSLSVNDFPYPADQPQQLTVSRIEVFMIPALAVDAAGYRICLRTTADQGYGWSEQFAGEHDSPLDLEEWKSSLQPFIGTFSLASLNERLTGLAAGATSGADTFRRDPRPYRLFASAIGALKVVEGPPPAAGRLSEESVLQQRAAAYLSIE